MTFQKPSRCHAASTIGLHRTTWTAPVRRRGIWNTEMNISPHKTCQKIQQERNHNWSEHELHHSDTSVVPTSVLGMSHTGMSHTGRLAGRLAKQSHNTHPLTTTVPGVLTLHSRGRGPILTSRSPWVNWGRVILYSPQHTLSGQLVLSSAYTQCTHRLVHYSNIMI